MQDKVIAGGHRLHYELINEAIDGPYLVFLHEGLGSVAKWKDFPKKVSDRLHLPALLYDRYGYGLSDPVEEIRQPDFLHVEAMDVLPEILEKLGINDKLILFGHSDGGSIALIYASVYPGRVKGLILEAPHVFIEPMSGSGIQSAVLSYDYGDFRERLFKYHGAHTESTFRSWVDVWTNPANRDWNIESCLPSITAPVLFIQGADDEFGTMAQLEAIKKGVKGIVIGEIIPGCGHVPHKHTEDIVLERVTAFVDKMV